MQPFSQSTVRDVACRIRSNQLRISLTAHAADWRENRFVQQYSLQ